MASVSMKTTLNASADRAWQAIRDFFIRDLIDYAPKDHPDMMERPFFSIAKRKRMKPIEYQNADGSVWIKVTGNPEHGMATIWDADILIYCISRIVAARDAGDNDFGPSIFVSPTARRPKIMARCETDLSPGGRTRPESGPEATALSGAAGAWVSVSNDVILGEECGTVPPSSSRAAARCHSRESGKVPGVVAC